MVKMMDKIRLKAIQFGTDFRCNEVSIFKKFEKDKNYPGALKEGEAYLFLSKKKDQLLWILHVDSPFYKKGRVEQLKFYDSRRWRIVGSTWNPMMLADYAALVNVELVGFRKFEEMYDQIRSKKTGKNRKLRRVA